MRGLVGSLDGETLIRGSREGGPNDAQLLGHLLHGGCVGFQAVVDLFAAGEQHPTGECCET